MHLEVKNCLLSDPPKQVKKSKKLSPEEYPLRHPQEIYKAAEYIIKYRPRLDHATKSILAERILERHESGEIHLDDKTYSTLLKEAGRGYGFISKVVAQLEKRARLLEKLGLSQHVEEIHKLTSDLSQIAGNAFYSTDLPEKICDMVNYIDKQANLIRYYGRSLEPIEDVLFEVTEKDVKEAERELCGNIKTGKYYRTEDIAKLDRQLCEKYLGEEFVADHFLGKTADVDKIKQWLKQSDVSRAQLFDTMLRHAEIRPYAEKIPQ